jgi:hypothetical protein
MTDETFPHPNEQAESQPLYTRPELQELAEHDPRLAQQIHGLELIDRGRKISDELKEQMGLALREYIARTYPDLLPGIEHPDAPQ